MSTGSTTDPNSVGELQAQVIVLMAERDAALAEVARLSAASPANAQIVAFQQNIQAITEQARRATEAMSIKMVEQAGHVPTALAFNTDEQVVLLALRTNEPFRLGTVAQAKSIMHVPQ